MNTVAVVDLVATLFQRYVHDELTMKIFDSKFSSFILCNSEKRNGTQGRMEDDACIVAAVVGYKGMH